MVATLRRAPHEKGRYHLIEAFRGLACLAVVLFHSLVSLGADLAPAYAGVRRVTNWGWLGVEVFFALSGWCIAERLAKAVERRESGGHFIAERVLRIYPTYWAVILLTIAIRLASAPFNSAGVAVAFPVGGRGWLDTLLITDPLGGTTPFLVVSWSLLYELAFYLCALAALVALRRRWVSGRVLFLTGAVLCLPLWVAADRVPGGQFLAFGVNFFVGVAAWWAARQGRRRDGYIFFAVLLVLGVAVSGGLTPAHLTALAMGLLLIAGWHGDGRVAPLPGMAALRWVGAISYSLYLIHVPVLSAVVNGGARLLPARTAGFGLVWLGALAAALAAGWAVNRFVEAPFERWRRRSF